MTADRAQGYVGSWGTACGAVGRSVQPEAASDRAGVCTYPGYGHRHNRPAHPPERLAKFGYQTPLCRPCG